MTDDKWFNHIPNGLLKARHGEYVLYKVDYLLDNLSREVSIMEGARRMSNEINTESDLISREALKEQFNGVPDSEDKDIALMLIDNAPTVKPCENCDLYFKAMTKEEMKKGGAV